MMVVVLSSDVVCPAGAMRRYEAKFWLPFKGTHKPIDAIPGNHDWYDTLEAFNATFLEPDAARAAMRARIEVDNRLTTTTDAGIEELIAQASRLRLEYEVPTGFQRAPFFQSFVEVVVEPSAGRVRLLPHGIHGRLRWSDLQMSGTLRPAGVPDEAFAEWTVEMPRAEPAARR